MVINRQVLRTELQYGGFFIMVSLIQTYFACPGCNTWKEYSLISFFTFIIWVLLWRGNNIVTHYVDSKISWFKFPTKRLVVGIISTITYTLAIVMCTMILFEKMFDFSFGRSFVWTIYFSVTVTILISLILHSREFLLSWKKAALDAEVLQKESIRREI